MSRTIETAVAGDCFVKTGDGFVHIAVCPQSFLAILNANIQLQQKHISLIAEIDDLKQAAKERFCAGCNSVLLPTKLTNQYDYIINTQRVELERLHAAIDEVIAQNGLTLLAKDQLLKAKAGAL